MKIVTNGGVKVGSVGSSARTPRTVRFREACFGTGGAARCKQSRRGRGENRGRLLPFAVASEALHVLQCKFALL